MKKSTVLILTALAGLMALGLTARTASAKSISGTPGNDIIRGTAGSDVIKTHGGNDVIYGGSGDDVIEAGDGRDIARGQSGDDEVIGGSDGDVLYGDAGRDGMDGDAGRDILHTTDGVRGNDSANGGPGADTCHGDRGDLQRSCSSAGDGSSGGGGNPPGGGGNGPGGEDTASGRCSLTGRITFADPVGFEPEQTTFTDRAEGTCTGFVNGEYMANERTLLRGAGGGSLSCGAARTISTGTLTYTRNTTTRSDDVVVDYIAESQGTFGQIGSRVRGRVSGESVGTVSFRGDPSAFEKCQAEMFRGGTYDTVGQTITPLVG